MSKTIQASLFLAILLLVTSCGPKVSKRCKKDWKNVKELRKRGMMM